MFCDCTARFVWDLVGNPEDRFSQNVAKMSYLFYCIWNVIRQKKSNVLFPETSEYFAGSVGEQIFWGIFSPHNHLKYHKNREINLICLKKFRVDPQKVGLVGFQGIWPNEKLYSFCESISDH